jgi:ABC-type lipoprotein release transport system permease subunit
MTAWRLILRSLVFFRRTNVGVLLGVAVAATVLVGALVVGDSVRASLRRQALQRIGRVDLVMSSHDRMFRAALADAIAEGLGGVDVAPALQLGGMASRFDARTRGGGVQVLGVDDRFFGMALDAGSARAPADGDVLLNGRLADRLQVATGDEILLRIEQPSAMPRDLVLATTDDVALALRLRVAGVVTDDAFGRFGLQSSQVPPLNAFLPLEWLQEQLELAGRANLLLLAGGDGEPITVERADAALRAGWTLDDGELAVQPADERDVVELSSRRIFIDEPVVDALAGAPAPLTGVLTYFVNELRSGDRATPYSMVSGIGHIGGDGAGAGGIAGVLPANLGDDGIVVTRWLADDLQVGPGDPVRLAYYVPGPGRALDVAEARFVVRSILEPGGPADDPTLMPAFPGLADAEHCRDWEPGIPIDLERVRDEDEAYWDERRGTPKAFVSLARARALWANRFGTLTAVRAPGADPDAIAGPLVERLDPAAIGLFFQDLRGPALAAGTSATDFGGLFLGLSIFLIVAALLLTALLFAFGVEQRRDQIGTLLAVGITRRGVRRLLLGEGIVLGVLGGILGAAAGLGYTALVLRGLATIWRDAVGAASLQLHASPTTLALGGLGSAIAAVGSIWLTLRRQVRQPAARLLAGGGGIAAPAGAGRARVSLVVAAACALAAIGIVMAVGADRGTAAAGAFFGAGTLLLIAGLAASRWLLARLDRNAGRSRLSIAGLGMRNSVRRRGRSLATVALLAAGCFLVIAVGANRLDALRDAGARSSGTGGFALFGRSTLGILHDLNTADGRDAYGITDEEMAGVDVVPLRVRDGDEASCLNLSVPQQPRLVGVDPAALAGRGAFTFARTIDGAPADPWLLLGQQTPDGTVPAIGDQASVTWVLHRAVGDVIEYRDERGRPLRVRIVGTVANSILQGNLLIDASRFETLFPSESGYRMLLVDAPPDRAAAVSETLTSELRDVGLELVPAVERLAEFNAVQNTYLSIFQMLGGLGLLLGSVGLGMVVARNVLERRGEIALLRAVGLRTRAIRWLVLSEHGLLLVLGLACGGIAAVVAVLPAVLSPGADVPYRSTALVLAGVAASGAGWVWLATVLVVRGRILDALRNE